MKVKFQLLTNTEKLIAYMNRILPNLPKKEMVLKNNIEKNQYELIENIFAFNINQSPRIREKYLKEILIKLSMFDFYMRQCFSKKYISKHQTNCLTKILVESRKILYELIRSEGEKMYNKLLEIENIEQSYHLVRNATKHKDKILNFEQFYMTNIMQIHRVLKNKAYQHGNYNIFLIKIPKYRIVMSENISDKIVNHMLSNELLKVIEPKLIEMNVATRTGKGLKKGLEYTKKYINHIKQKSDEIYVLKCDIKKYFYNVDHEILCKKLNKVIQDKDIMDIIKNILSTTNNPYYNESIQKIIKKEKNYIISLNLNDLPRKLNELDRIPVYAFGKGLPIGNMTSQIFAIFYLNDLDHFIKEKLQIKHYIRYMDDFVLFSHDKNYLKYCWSEIEKKLAREKLELNGKTQIINLKQGFNFLGYRFQLKGKKLYVLMTSQTKKRIRKNLNRVTRKNFKNKDNVLASYKGYFITCSCGSFLHNHKWYEKKVENYE